ncbi:MAG TPA: Crp/Fnr family transcriptional regulator [Steroidobacteraceae bacterium]
MRALHARDSPGLGGTYKSPRLQGALLQLTADGPEQQAIEAGEIDAVIDYSRSNVILLPAARIALLDRARRIPPIKRAITTNRLLATLPQAEIQCLLDGLELVTLQRGAALHEPGAPILHAYFPIDSVICLLATVQYERAVEVGLVGYEGMVGISLVLEANDSSVRAQVVTRGTALRIESAFFRSALRKCAILRRELLRHADAKLALARGNVVCNRYHLIEARLARWLLMTSDRILSHEFSVTHDSLAGMLAVRRVSITKAAGHLQSRGLIKYARGKICIVDRHGLEGASCPCYFKID